ncbi:MAG: tRNA pseudouridine(55) synthase TruB [Parachlamydiales bacterium]
MNIEQPAQGILVVDKPAGITSFTLVACCRRVTGVKKIGHAGTLDPFATGVMVLMIGRDFTRLCDQYTAMDKVYETTLHLGIETDSYDVDGNITRQSDHVPSLSDINDALLTFQGVQQQIPPMFSAKKVKGQKLYHLARQGVTIERTPVQVNMTVELLEYAYPHLRLRIECSKGTYIRSLAYDLGQKLQCGAHLIQLRRIRSGAFNLDNSLDGAKLKSGEVTLEELKSHLLPAMTT